MKEEREKERKRGSSPAILKGMMKKTERIVKRAERVEQTSGLSHQVPPNGLTLSPPSRGFYWGELPEGACSCKRRTTRDQTKKSEHGQRAEGASGESCTGKAK